ncbi:MAG: hypothetical protein KBG67_03190 [Candidatus Atribacteria bacterium]|nr:hypothetical protein [Candidatus Atribacteria bacterium]
MFLDIWLKSLNYQMGWYIFFFSLLFLGIIIGFFFQRFYKLFYVISTFLFFLIIGRLLLFNLNPVKWTRNIVDHWFFEPKSFIFWLAIILSLIISVLVISSKKGEFMGRFFSGFIITLNLFYTLIWLSEWVELIRFLSYLSFLGVIGISILMGILVLNWKGLLRTLSSLLGSSLLIIAFCEVLKRLGESDTFFGQSPFVLFVFLVGAVLMDAVQSRS